MLNLVNAKFLVPVLIHSNLLSFVLPAHSMLIVNPEIMQISLSSVFVLPLNYLCVILILNLYICAT